MKNNVACWIFLLAVLVAPTIVAGKEVSQYQNGIDFSVVVGPERVVIGEPVELAVRVKNEGGNRNEPMEMALSFPEGGDVKVMVQTQGELPYRYEGTEKSSFFVRENVEIAVGRTYERRLPIYYDKKATNGLLFGRSGWVNISVEVAAIVGGKAFKVKTGWIAIQVLNPSVGEKQALDLLAGRNVAEAIQTGFSTDPQVAEALESYLKSYPNGPLAPLAKFTLIGSYSNMGEHRKVGEAGMEFLSKWATHFRCDDVIFMLANSAVMQRDYDLARAWYFYLRDIRPGYRLLSQYNDLSYNLYHGCVPVGENRRWYLYDKAWDFPAPPRQGR